MFKGYGTNVNQIPTNELTISIFYEAYPRKMLLIIEMEGHTIEEKYPGIYYVYDFPFPVQIVVIKQLRSGEHKSLKVLSLNADRDDIKAFLKETEDLYSLREKQNVDAVLLASVRANYELYEEIRREPTMCEALRELMKDEIEKEEMRWLMLLCDFEKESQRNNCLVVGLMRTRLNSHLQLSSGARE